MQIICKEQSVQKVRGSEYFLNTQPKHQWPGI